MNKLTKAVTFIIVIIVIKIIFFSELHAAVRINEIYPAPTGSEFEWIELYNDEGKSIDLTGFSLTDLAGTKLKFERASIESLGFLIATSSAILNNTGDTLFLKNNLNENIEIATYSASFNSNQSYGKCPDGSSNFFKLETQTKTSSNQPACLALTPTPSPTPTTLSVVNDPLSGSTPTPTINSIANVYISEVMVNPESRGTEWIELYNDNAFAVSLENWYIDDVEDAGSSPKLFSIEIAAKSYAMYDLSTSMFNNDGDSVRLLDPEKTPKDSFEYTESERGQTLGRIEFTDDNFCTQLPSKGIVNNSCIPKITAIPTISPTKILINIQSSPKTKAKIAFSDNAAPRANLRSDVLGAQTEIAPQQSTSHARSLTRTFSFISFSYSLLTIVSVLARMKIGA